MMIWPSLILSRGCEMMQDAIKTKVWDVGGWQKPGGYNTYQRWASCWLTPTAPVSSQGAHWQHRQNVS